MSTSELIIIGLLSFDYFFGRIFQAKESFSQDEQRFSLIGCLSWMYRFNFKSFGFSAGLCLVIQIITGAFLAMHHTPHIDLAFKSVEHIMVYVNNGWLIRYLHANGAFMFFIVVYCHIFRGLYYGSYIYPRGLLWASGVIIFLLMMATAFMGYVLSWGQMSFWGATVITTLFSAIPLVGNAVVELLPG
eukprot:gene6630-9104_t